MRVEHGHFDLPVHSVGNGNIGKLSQKSITYIKLALPIGTAIVTVTAVYLYSFFSTWGFASILRYGRDRLIAINEEACLNGQNVSGCANGVYCPDHIVNDLFPYGPMTKACINNPNPNAPVVFEIFLRSKDNMLEHLEKRNIFERTFDSFASLFPGLNPSMNEESRSKEEIDGIKV
jgi:hypothetical protein